MIEDVEFDESWEAFDKLFGFGGGSSKCPDTWKACSYCRRYSFLSSLVLHLFSLCIYSSFSYEKGVINLICRIQTLKVPT